MCGGSGGFHGPLSQEPAPKSPTGSLGVCGPQPRPLGCTAYTVAFISRKPRPEPAWEPGSLCCHHKAA